MQGVCKRLQDSMYHQGAVAVMAMELSFQGFELRSVFLHVHIDAVAEGH